MGAVVSTTWFCDKPDCDEFCQSATQVSKDWKIIRVHDIIVGSNGPANQSAFAATPSNISLIYCPKHAIELGKV